MAARVAIIHPSRWRALQALAIFLEWVSSAEHPDAVEYILALDDDDETIPEYQRLFTQDIISKVNRFVMLISPTRSIVQALNAAAQQLSITTEILVAVSDDVGSMKDWDRLLIEATSEIDNFTIPKYIGVSDGLQYFGSFLIYVANRAFYTTLGYVQYSGYDGCFADDDIREKAKKMNAILPLPHIIFEHRHYSTGKTPHDRTYARHNEPNSVQRNKCVYDKRAQDDFN